MGAEAGSFACWLNVSMKSHGLSQAALARAVGVADTQVSRWRRGQVVPTLRYLQQIADTFSVPRATLDRLAGYPVPDVAESAADGPPEPAALAELQACQTRYRQLLEEKVPRPMWRAYLVACESLADALSTSFRNTLAEVPGLATLEPAGATGEALRKDEHLLGFRRDRGPEGAE